MLNEVKKRGSEMKAAVKSLDKRKDVPFLTTVEATAATVTTRLSAFASIDATSNIFIAAKAIGSLTIATVI